jgi:hypothetical protein
MVRNRQYALVAMHRFWMEFDSAEATRFGLGAGCGVTAIDVDDALSLLGEVLGRNPPAPVHLIEDVDVSTLDPRHVLPNMYPPNERGVWFPMLGGFK